MPVVYAYATTMRRAQGATLDLVGLYFDRRKADRGYAYVGVSRVKRQADAYHVGRIRRSDWLPVGGDPRGNEQDAPGIMSESDSEEPSSTSEAEQSDDAVSETSGASQEPDVTAWNTLGPRAWEEPISDEAPSQQSTPRSEEPEPTQSDFGGTESKPSQQSNDSQDSSEASNWGFHFEEGQNPERPTATSHTWASLFG